MLSATYDPAANVQFMTKTLRPDQITKFTINEALFKIMNVLTAQV
jgi:hypothetical protein